LLYLEGKLEIHTSERGQGDMCRLFDSCQIKHTLINRTKQHKKGKKYSVMEDKW